MSKVLIYLNEDEIDQAIIEWVSENYGLPLDDVSIDNSEVTWAQVQCDSLPTKEPKKQEDD